MTTADGATAAPRPRIHIWVLPDSIAFTQTGGRKSLLALVKCASALTRSVAETRAGAEGRLRLSRSYLAGVASELFERAATSIPCTTVAQSHQPDVWIELDRDSVDVFFSKLLTPQELERAATFMLRSSFTGCMTAGVVLSAGEFYDWLADLVVVAHSVKRGA